MLFTRLERKARLKLLLPLTGADPGRLEELLLVHHLHRVLLETLNLRDSSTCRHRMVHQASRSVLEGRISLWIIVFERRIVFVRTSGMLPEDLHKVGLGYRIA